MKLVSLDIPKNVYSEYSRLCSGILCPRSEFGAMLRGKQFQWIRPGVAAIYKNNHGEQLGWLVTKAVTNGGQFYNMPSNLTGTWLRKIYLCDINGYAILSLHIPLSPNNATHVLNITSLAVIANMLHDRATVHLVASMNERLQLEPEYTTYATWGTDDVFVDDGIVNMTHNTSINVSLARLYFDAVATMIGSVCDILIQKCRDPNLLHRIASIRARSHSYSTRKMWEWLSVNELQSIGIKFENGVSRMYLPE